MRLQFTFSSQNRYERCLAVLGDIWARETPWPDYYPVFSDMVFEAVYYHKDP